MLNLKLGVLALLIFQIVAAPLCASADVCQTMRADQSIAKIEAQHHSHSQKHHNSSSEHDRQGQEQGQSCDHCNQSSSAVTLSSCDEKVAARIDLNGSPIYRVAEEVSLVTRWITPRIVLPPPIKMFRFTANDLWQEVLRIRL